MRHRKILFSLTCAVLFVTARASAQTCQGAGLFPVRRSYQLGVSAISTGSISSGAGTFVSGDRGGYVDVKIGQLRDPSRGGSSMLVAMHGATQVSPDYDHRYVFCPGVGVIKEWGPSRIGDQGNTYSGTSYYAGLDFGMLAIDRADFKWVPIAGLTFTRSRLDIEAQRNENAVRQTESGSDSYPVVHVGFGVILNDRVSIAPRVTFPLHTNAAKRGAQLQVVYSFGPRS